MTNTVNVTYVMHDGKVVYNIVEYKFTCMQNKLDVTPILVPFQRSVRMWSRGEEHVRVLAFLGIRNVATMMPSSLLEFSVKVCISDALV